MLTIAGLTLVAIAFTSMLLCRPFDPDELLPDDEPPEELGSCDCDAGSTLEAFELSVVWFAPIV